jgi:hypothetical protein
MTTIITSFIAITGAFLIGCASAPQSKFTADTMTTVKTGMTKAEGTGLFREPRSRSAESDGSETWQYRKNAQEGKGLKTYMDVASLRLTANHGAEYQDILTVVFKDGGVLKTTYQENVNMYSSFSAPRS